MSIPVIIIGAGGHARVVADALLLGGMQVLGYTDTDSTHHGAKLFGLPVLGADDVLERYDPREVVLANGIGGVGRRIPGCGRRVIQERLAERGWSFTTVIHPTAIVSPRAQIGNGVHLLAGASIQAGSRIGDGCIVNTGAVVEHDVTLGVFTHVASGAVVCGDVNIGADSHIGAGAIVRQGLKLGADTIVGAGAVVVDDFGGNCLLVGVPARLREHRR